MLLHGRFVAATKGAVTAQLKLKFGQVRAWRITAL
jgi:hypothetical protein